MRRLAALLFLALAMVAAAPAMGKGVESVRVCGESECRSLSSAANGGRELSSWAFGGATVGTSLDQPSRSAQRWRASVAVMAGEDGQDTELVHQIVVPGQAFLRREGQWQRMSAGATEQWAALTKGIAPLPPVKRTPDAVDDGASADTTAASTGGGVAVWPWLALAALCLVAFWGLRRRIGGR